MQLTSVLLALNSFHKYEKLTTEIEKDNTIFFLDILIRRKPGKIETTVYRKANLGKSKLDQGHKF